MAGSTLKKEKGTGLLDGWLHIEGRDIGLLDGWLHIEGRDRLLDGWLHI